MKAPAAMNFKDDLVARAYDAGLVPIIFEPWAQRLINENGSWYGCQVVDLATGSGVVACKLSAAVGMSGKIFATDISAEMLHVAREKCSSCEPPVHFVESPAAPLALSSHVADRVVCQQGFQFFPDRRAAAAEIMRVLRPGGDVIVSTWCPVDECHWVEMICRALSDVREYGLLEIMKVPFDHMPAPELAEAFEIAGFSEIHITTKTADLIFPGGFAQAIEASYTTPVGADLKSLTASKRASYRASLTRHLQSLSDDGKTMGQMASLVLTAKKPEHIYEPLL